MVWLTLLNSAHRALLVPLLHLFSSSQTPNVQLIESILFQNILPLSHDSKYMFPYVTCCVMHYLSLLLIIDNNNDNK